MVQWEYLLFPFWIQIFLYILSKISCGFNIYYCFLWCLSLHCFPFYYLCHYCWNSSYRLLGKYISTFYWNFSDFSFFTVVLQTKSLCKAGWLTLLGWGFVISHCCLSYFLPQLQHYLQIWVDIFIHFKEFKLWPFHPALFWVKVDQIVELIQMKKLDRILLPVHCWKNGLHSLIHMILAVAPIVQIEEHNIC